MFKLMVCEMETERADAGSMRCLVNRLKFMNLECFTRTRDRIQGGDIPEWLLIEVLVKLPAKFVLRFKLVSKQWFSIISDPYFRREYTSRAPQPWTYISHIMHHKGSQSPHLLEFELLEDIYSQALKPGYFVLPLPHTQQTRDGDVYFVCGVRNGLVLYGLIQGSRDRRRSYYIYNPVTGQWITIPPFTSPLDTDGCSFLTHVEDGILKSYTVVRIHKLYGSNIVIFDVFSSDVGEWKMHYVPCDFDDYFTLRLDATALNGVLHWISFDNGIIAYDPNRRPEQMRVIPLPVASMNKQKLQRNLCAAYQGKLRYFEVSGWHVTGNQFPQFKLWVLNDYSCDDWCLLHEVCYEDVHLGVIPSLKTSILPALSFHPFDDDIMLLGFDDLLLSYNIATRKIEVQWKCHSETPSEVRPPWLFAFFLTIPAWPLSIPCSFRGGEQG